MDTGISEPLRALTAAHEGRIPRMRVGAGALVVLLLLALAGATLVSALSPAGSTSIIAPGSSGDHQVPSGADGTPGTDPSGMPTSSGSGNAAGAPSGSGSAPGLVETDAAAPAAAPPATFFVHVLGAVTRPGLYDVADSARVIDAIAAAGGLTDAADPARVNLARRIGDGEQLYVPAMGEEVPPELQPPPAVTRSTPGAASGGPPGLVNLNSATVAELDTLPRIGPALAQRILEWREANGRFASVDDLLGVPGIGEKIVDGLRPAATV
ncbi:helix-hairpin-helix domain-containing protein [Planctomonas psychrotolerans]|uniref:helix-hairpin-helix domain-containing protein n=1 Tax=Planctomonas psychrotolerans TaxID=2528712 RepID=UPI0029D40FD1|nr:helix-hairpin-helix domain-containing protein [Planctomonas psychrotolerans]